MSENIYNAVTLSDLAKLQAADGSPIPDIVNMMAQTNEILDDMTWKPTNEENAEVVAILNGIPEPTWRMLNQGVKPTKGEYSQVRETCAMLEDRSEIDVEMFRKNGAALKYRISEASAKLEGFSRAVANALFYADQKVTPQKFTGIAPRFCQKSTDEMKSGYNVIDAQGTGSNLTSIYLVGWGAKSVYGITPKNSVAGFRHQDLGEYTKTMADGSQMQVVGDLFHWDLGFAVRDWRYIVRIANIDIDTLSSKKSTGADLTDLMIEATERIKDLNTVKPAFYCSRKISTMLRKQILNTNNVFVTPGEVAGKHVTMFDGIPVRRVDQISTTEAKVS